MSSTIILDVEGVLFKTRISTLTSIKNTYFYAIFQEDWSKLLDRRGHLFIDRDASIFPVILNYLRDKHLTPLPTDKYILAKIHREASFFLIKDLCDRIEKCLSYGTFQNVRCTCNSSHIGQRQETTFSASDSISSASGGPILSHSLTPFIDDPPIPIKKSTLDRRLSKKKNKIDSISLPRNFAHIAHVGWNGNGIILQKHLLGDETTVRAIIDAASEADLNPVYNMVNSENGSSDSHSVEVVLSGVHMQSPSPPSRPPPHSIPSFRSNSSLK